MNFIGMPGVNYELQHSADLNVWSPVNPPLILTGVGAQTPVVDRTSGGAAHRYYRFVQLAHGARDRHTPTRSPGLTCRSILHLKPPPACAIPWFA